MKTLFRSLLASIPALFLYLAVLPWAALGLDHRLGLIWHLPGWIEPVSGLLVLAGAGLGAWSFWELTIRGKGTPNPLFPAARLVQGGPFRYSRNPLMLGGWLCGAGLAGLLRSPCLLWGVGLLVAGGMLYVRRVEEPGLLARFGGAWQRYAARTPRWVVLAVIAGIMLAGLPALTKESEVVHVSGER